MLGEYLLKLLGVSPIVLGILAMFWKGDEAISDEFREAISKWLKKTITIRTRELWPSIVHAQFERIYGKKHFTFQCFIGSVKISLIAFAVISLSVYITYSYITINYLLASFVLSIYYNIFIDYFSLIKTRYLLNFIIHSKKSMYKIVTLIFDVIFTVVIFNVGSFIVVYVLFIIDPNFLAHRYVFDGLNVDYKAMSNWFYLLTDDQEFINSDYGAAATNMMLINIIPFFTTFVNSIWIALSILGSALLRLAPGVFYILKIDTNPVRSIGLSAGFFVFCLYSILELIP